MELDVPGPSSDADSAIPNGRETSQERAVIDVDDYFSAELISHLSTELIAAIAQDRDRGIELTRSVLAQRASWPEQRVRIIEVAADALREARVEGLNTLADIVRSNARPTVRATCLRTLWSISCGTAPATLTPVPERPVHSEDAEYARNVLTDVIVESLSDLDLAEVFWREMSVTERAPSGEPLGTFYVKVAGEAQITLTTRVVEDFEALIAEAHAEQVYQDYLTQHAGLLDLASAEVIPLAPLGLEFKTDFVLRRHDGRYIVIEIEKPQDRIFTNQVDFTHEFTHAVGQVLDFQQWVAENVAYATKHFPGIASPDGIVVIGRRADLDERRERKLERWQVNSNSIEIFTFDDLSTRARHILTSLRASR